MPLQGKNIEVLPHCATLQPYSKSLNDVVHKREFSVGIGNFESFEPLGFYILLLLQEDLGARVPLPRQRIGALHRGVFGG